MLLTELKKDIIYVGSIDWDRRLFDELIPIPQGTTYNSYLIIGKEKTAIIDAVDPSKNNELLENLKSKNIKKIDYIISNHAEQDHSGAIVDLLKIYPEAKIVTNEKCADMLFEHLLIPKYRFIIIENGDIISLGDKHLEFMLTPWTHWPETMITYLKEDKILFTCDLFGSHYATSSLYVDDERKVYFAAKRYYAEIMMPFRIHIRKYIEKLRNYKIDMIAPSHGPVYQNPQFILDAYDDWTSDKVKTEVVIPFVSMHDSTRKMVDYFVKKLIEKNIIVKHFNLTKTDIGELVMDLVNASTLILATPTVLGGPHPQALYAVYLTNLLRPKLRYISVIGSYGWGGKMLDIIKEMTYNLKAEILNPVVIKGYPKDIDFRKLDDLVDIIWEKNKNI